MAVVVVTWVGLIAVFLGIGVSFRGFFGLGTDRARQWLALPLIGWCIALAFLQLWHLFLPVDKRALFVVAGSGIVAISWNGRDLWNILVRSAWKTAGFAAVFLLAALWLANQTTNQPGIYDSGLYHLNAVRWAHSYPIVPGLANLHSRLGFNSSFFLYAAMLEIGPFLHRSHHIASGLLFLFVIPVGLYGGWRVMFRGSRRIGDIADALFLLPVVAWAVNSGYATSPSPDVPVFLLGVAVGCELLHLLSESGAPGGETIFSAFCIVLLSCAGVSSKLSFLFTGGTAALVAVAFALRRLDAPRLRWRLLWCIIVPILVIGPWMARSILLSGYPLYPSTFARVDAEWSVPPDDAAASNSDVKAWAKAPGPGYRDAISGFRWVRHWLSSMTRRYFDVVTPLMLSVLGLAGVFLFGMSRTGPPANRAVWLFFIVPVASLGFCLLTAPDPRFAGASFWLLGAGVLAVALSMCATDTVRLGIALYSVLLFSQNVNVIDFLHQWHKDTGPAKTVGMKTMTTDSGLTIFIPLEGDQPWDSALPATPYFNRKLRLRNADDISKGFTVKSPER
jgi:hypothetical protein